MKEAASLAAELGLRGADSVYVAVASRLDIPLATLDADQYLKVCTLCSFLLGWLHFENFLDFGSQGLVQILAYLFKKAGEESRP